MAAPLKSIMQYFIKMADISILADVPYFLHLSRSTTAFLCPASDGLKADLDFVIRPIDVLPEIRNVRHIEPKRLYVGEGEDTGTFFRSHPEKAPYAFASRRTVKDGRLICVYIPGNEEYINYSRNLVTLMDIEATLLDFKALILHSSLIRWKSGSIVFTAPSGTGKSTQASLWERYEGAEVLNGDRAALRQINGVWTAFGLPYAGTSGIYRNESAPLKASVALRQADENRVRRIIGAEAFRYIYPETMIHRWDADFEKRASDLLLQLMGDIPMFLLECRPDRKAVELLRDTLELS